MRCSIVSSLDEVPARDWNRLAGPANPFVSHEFLVALERHGCVTAEAGWCPQHLLVYEGEELVGAVPMYLKSHSYGEYVFDWAWADAYARYGHRYYPKLITAVPFTPVTGPRLLTAGADWSWLKSVLAEVAVNIADSNEISSLHWLFTGEDDTSALSAEHRVHRLGCQYHWANAGFESFDDFLDALRAKKRKEVKRERRQVEESDIEVEVRVGPEIGEAEWDAFYTFYCATYDRKWGVPYLSLGFFQEIGATLPEAVVLILARRAGKYIAGALCMRGADTLYGRNWGCAQYHPALHYEMCYYRTIDFCIQHKLARFEAGAQGEYKVSRGLLPTVTHSVHWIRQPEFRDAIRSFVERERAGILGYVSHMERHSPYKRASNE